MRSLIIIGITVGSIILARVLRFLLNRYFLKASTNLKIDVTQFKFLKNAITFIIFCLAIFSIFYTIPKLRALALTLFASAGIFAAILGLASQQAFSNIISGIFIVIFKPFRVEDRITIGTDITGVVEDITLRHTIIRNFENQRIIIPNSVVSSQVVQNATIFDQKICKHLIFSISYDSDITLAMKIIQEEAVAHQFCIDNRTAEELEQGIPQVITRVIKLGDFSVDIKAWVWSDSPPNAFEMGCDLMRSVKERFDREGVEIPFPYRTVVYKKDLETNQKLESNEPK